MNLTVVYRSVSVEIALLDNTKLSTIKNQNLSQTKTLRKGIPERYKLTKSSASFIANADGIWKRRTNKLYNY